MTPPKKDAPATLSFTIEQRKAAFAAVATKYLTPDRLVKLAQVALARVRGLSECTTLSVLDSLMLCSRLGLEPAVAGGVWLVPFRDKRQGGAKVCTPIIDYRGLIDVARRSGAVAAVHADLRCERDLWEYWIDSEARSLVHLRHAPAEGDVDDEPAAGQPRREPDTLESMEGRGRVLGAYFTARLTSGQCQAVYLTRRQIERYRDRSRAAQSEDSPWKTDPHAMMIKTVCRRGVNLLPRSPELQVLREAIADEDAFDVGAADKNAGARSRVRALAAAGGEPSGTGLEDDGVPFETAEEQAQREAEERAAGQGGEAGQGEPKDQG